MLIPPYVWCFIPYGSRFNYTLITIISSKYVELKSHTISWIAKMSFILQSRWIYTLRLIKRKKKKSLSESDQRVSDRNNEQNAAHHKLSLKAIWCDVVSPFSFKLLYILNGIPLHRGRIINDLWILKRIFYSSGHMGSLFVMNVIEITVDNGAEDKWM